MRIRCNAPQIEQGGPRCVRRLPKLLWRLAARKLDQLHRVVELAELRIPPDNCLEMLKGDRMGQHSIRINAQYRICFIWNEDGPVEVEVVDYH